MTTPVPLSACIISFREADRIEDCVRSVAFCDEVLVVDSGSDDGTIELARDLGADVQVNAPFPGHREQKQLAVDRAKHDWVLCVDSDERVTPELRDEIEALRRSGRLDDAAGYEMPRRNHYLGRVVRRGLHWPDRKIRLFDRRRAHWGGTNPHDKVFLDDGAKPVRLAGALEHLSYRDFEHQKRTLDSFSAIAAKALFDKGRRAGPFDLFVRPLAVFVKGAVLKRGFLDGWRGILTAVMGSYYVWLKYTRLRALWRASR